ncbi:MAG: DUF1460 domain-containing protein [Ignavibacteria bacterium]|nr:DUF1460 domain-containing protein [Ignavibacteria bacterium]
MTLTLGHMTLTNFAFFLFSLLLFHSFAQPQDRLITNRIFADAFEHKLIDKPTGEVIVHVGKEFIGAPYNAGTLDKSDSEELACNLHGFDCVTFVENVLALSRCIKNNTLSYDAYQRELQVIRYRGGTIIGYGSRLHYFTDWIYDNEQKGIVNDITKELGGIPYRKTINFMSTHQHLYPRLSDDSSLIKIKQIEEKFRNRQLSYIPKSQIQGLQSSIKSGDIIAITTTQVGLDIAHTGIAIRLDDGTLHYLHAPDIGDSVRITNETLSKYLQKHPVQSGIMVIRASK